MSVVSWASWVGQEMGGKQWETGAAAGKGTEAVGGIGSGSGCGTR